jgi:Protein of unknown function (DUF3386)
MARFDRWPSRLACLAICLSAAPAQAHFVWIIVAPDEKAPTVQIVFGETAEPGDAKLIGKIAQTKAWARLSDGQSTPLEVSSPADAGQPAALVAKPPENTVDVEAACDYGVYARAPGGVRLHYFAKCLVAGSKAAPSERLRLDIAADIHDGKADLTVRFDGQPDSTAELLAIDSQADEKPIKLDDDGRATVDLPADQRLTLRAKHVALQDAGEAAGKRYSQTWYCSTLVLAPDQKLIENAGQALTKARAGRALWTDFPGFSADVTVLSDEGTLDAQATIDASGVVTLSGDRSTLHDWVQEQLQSLVQHRMPDGEVSEGSVVFVPEPATHPLGRLIDLGEERMHSRYRLKDDVIREVNRTMGPSRFTISVLAIRRNDDGKYLPEAFTMTFWDVASGQLKRSLAYWNQWRRVGGFDLPEHIIEVSAGSEGAKTRQLTLRNQRLLDRPSAAAGR